MKKLRTVFMGTPNFAVPCLKKLHEHHEVLAVVTQPDRPKGRGQKLQSSAVKQFALTAGLNILQPEKIKTPVFESLLKDLRPDVIVVVAFGQILSKTILDIPPLGCVNVHASLLPNYRGAAPIHWSIIRGETKTGVTTIFMDTGLDTGDMILHKEVNISQEMTTGELHDTLMNLGAEVLCETICLLVKGTALRTPQNENTSSYAPLLKKSIEKIDWTQTADVIHNLIRGLNPWPGAYCLLNGKILKIWKTQIVKALNRDTKPGEVLRITEDGFHVGTGDGILEVLELQPANKRKMSAKDYVCGNGIHINNRFE